MKFDGELTKDEILDPATPEGFYRVTDAPLETVNEIYERL